ncbi:polyprotein [Bushbush virus]|uniref:Envelopment polyprotein n=1 Tax=Bushbush virus TaxID=2748203 RepID=A0A7D9MVY9_9VIRU|nr:polyprotein [Bushbush virus]QLA47077.1 polyprotein [Bushbush virus]
MIMSTILFILMLYKAFSVPIDNRCFSDGVISKTKTMDHGIAEICIKDDISIVKTTSAQIRNTSQYVNTVYRKMLIQNYENCNPEETPNGPIMIFKPNDDLMLIPHTYACRIPCTISLDEEEANIILHSESLNHYEVMGTTTANRWFQGTSSYSLEHTCEHIQVTCGSTSLSFHACFKYHMACIRLLNRSYMPAFMVQSVCQNKELILMTCLVLIIFGLLYIMTMTYICYILIPVFYPFTYIWGFLYNKSCKKCYYCGLAYHPFTKCGKNCVCGCMFENSERMKKHRESGMCKGFKSLRAARILCKNRGSSLVLAVILSFLLLSFVQPIEGVKLKYNEDIFELETVTKEFDIIYEKLDKATVFHILNICILSIALIVFCISLIMKKRINNYFFSKIVYYCQECNMTHPKRDLTYFGDFTNKCNTCMCGCNINISDESDYMIPIVHNPGRNCFIPGKYYAYRRTDKIQYKVIFFFILLLMTLSAVSASSCDSFINNPGIKEPIQCSVWYRLPTNCDSTGDITEVFKQFKLPRVDQDALKSKTSSLSAMLAESESVTTPVGSFLIESSALKLHCNDLADARKKSGRLSKMITKVFEKSPLEVCTNGKAPSLCECLKGDSSCTSVSLAEAVTYYKTNQQIFRDDISKVINAIIKVYGGILSREINLALKDSNFTKLKDIATKMHNKFGSAESTNMCFNYLKTVLAETTLENINPNIQTPRPVVPFVSPQPNIFTSVVTASEITICKSAKLYRCSYQIAARFTYMLSCGSNTNMFYEIPEDGVAYKHGSTTDLCALDPHCNAKMTGVLAENKDELQSLNCRSQDFSVLDFTKFESISKCHKMSAQTCTYNNQNKTFVECKNGFFYEYTKLWQSAGDDIGVYCFHSDCKYKAIPHHVSNLDGCILHRSNLESRKLKEIIYENIEQLKHSLEEAIKTDLVEHRYQPTMNLPKIAPTFKAVSIMGVETENGVDSAYIETNVIARTGSSIGINLKTKKGESLFDIIIFVKSAHYETTASLAYTTGPTVGINLQHDEKCTGTCPTNLAKPGWLSFAKEHTSNWGCEEFGCLAINTGCLYGHCRDIIKPETRIYKKDDELTPRISLCITLPDSSYCHDIDSFSSIVSDKLEIQFLSNEAGRMPNMFAYKSNTVMTGLINERGTYAKMCGSVQDYNGGVWGAGNPKIDYICHAARRKDVTAGRCFDNFYESCSTLTKNKDLIYDDKDNKVKLLNKIMGEMRIKIKLGDIRYKVFEKEPSIDVKATCVGCIDCIKGVDCELDISATVESVCPVKSNCYLFHNNMRIEPNTRKYGLKMKCSTSDIEIEICSTKASVQMTLVDKKDTIEVGNSDQTYFVKEKDMRCGTWLCKVSEQGISSIFAPFISIFGSYGKIAFYSVLGVLCFALFIYLTLPMCARFKDILKKNEIEYIRENYGYKSLDRRQ